MALGFGVDLGGTTVKLACFEENGTMVSKWEIPTRTQENGKYILADIAASIDGYIAENNLDKNTLLGIGIGVPGPVSHQGVVNRCINLGWGVFNIAKQLEDLTGLSVRAANDATVAALGEAWQGSAKGCGDVLLATLGTGVGGGVIVDGKPLHGAFGAAGEIGHFVVNREETEQCNCGNYGCVEQYCSATGVVRLAKRALSKSDAPSVLRQETELSSKVIFDAAKAGDPLALEIAEQVYRYMGEFLATVACVTNPRIIVLGGGMSKAGQMLLDGIKPYFDRHVFHACRNVEFCLASLGNDAGAYGAFRLILEEKG